MIELEDFRDIIEVVIITNSHDLYSKFSHGVWVEFDEEIRCVS